jgi:hypothetical protein
MAGKILFMLVPTGGYGNVRAELSAFDQTRRSQPFVDNINAELVRLRPGMLASDAMASAMKVLERHGFGAPGSAGLFEDPRPAQRKLRSNSVRRAIARGTARSGARR